MEPFIFSQVRIKCNTNRINETYYSVDAERTGSDDGSVLLMFLCSVEFLACIVFLDNFCRINNFIFLCHVDFIYSGPQETCCKLN